MGYMLASSNKLSYFSNHDRYCRIFSIFDKNQTMNASGFGTQPPCTFWLTGLSGAGKSTLARLLKQELANRGHSCVILDGDEMRQGLCRDLGFSDKDRSENIRRTAEVAALLNRSGLYAIVALISPSGADRANARTLIGDPSMLEIYLSTSLAVCESRDPKGLYVRARAGNLPHFTGIDAPYEAPLSPQLTLDTARYSPAQCVEQILGLLAPGRAPCKA